MAENSIMCRAIVQMAGSPKDHIEKTIRMYIDKLKEDYKKEMKVKKEHYGNAEKEEEGGLFNVFCELDIEFHKLENIALFCIDYMPASIEIIKPDELIYGAGELTDFLNDLLSKLHRIDMALKVSNAKNKSLEKNGIVLAKNLMMVILSKGPANINEISKLAGMPESHAEKFLDTLEKEGKIKKDKGLYSLK